MPVEEVSEIALCIEFKTRLIFLRVRKGVVGVADQGAKDVRGVLILRPIAGEETAVAGPRDPENAAGDGHELIDPVEEPAGPQRRGIGDDHGEPSRLGYIDG